MPHNVGDGDHRNNIKGGKKKDSLQFLPTLSPFSAPRPTTTHPNAGQGCSTLTEQGVSTACYWKCTWLQEDSRLRNHSAFYKSWPLCPEQSCYSSTVLEAPACRVTPWWGPAQGTCGTQLLISKYASGMDCVGHAGWLRGIETNGA